MKVSIIIPVKADNKNLRECVEKCLELDYKDFEIVVLPDDNIVLPYAEKIRIAPTGNVGPAKKRDMAVEMARGDILAFLDDDALPRRDWLKNAIGLFNAEDVGAVCGPSITPDTDTLRQKASGGVYASYLVSGPHNRRYGPREQCEVDDYPSCNFLVRKSVFKKVGGFDTKFWPGEDTIFCLKIIKDLGKKIIYDPRVLVYHHRRPLFKTHLKQIASYALHRGYFVKRFPATSFRISYFIPSIFVLGLVGGGILSIISPTVKFIYLWLMVVYLALTFFSSLRGGRRPTKQSQKKRLLRSCFGYASQSLAMTVRLSALVFLGIISTHLTYGVYFIKGLFSKRLVEE
jgi:GT2 family glycosyltransferase